MLNTKLPFKLFFVLQLNHAVFTCHQQELESIAKSVKPATKKGGGRVSKKGKDTPGSDANDDFPLPQKPSTTMKKRGEESDDAKYIGKEM